MTREHSTTADNDITVKLVIGRGFTRRRRYPCGLKRPDRTQGGPLQRQLLGPLLGTFLPPL